MKGAGRLTRLAMVERSCGSVRRAARQLKLPPRRLFDWLERLEEREGGAHLPSYTYAVDQRRIGNQNARKART